MAENESLDLGGAYPLRNVRAKHCGVCPACVFRRQAMYIAGITEPDDMYEDDFMAVPLPENLIPEKRLKYLKAFLMQAAQLKDVESTKRLPARFERHVLATGLLRRGEPQENLIELLARYRDEWMKMASHARMSGHAWAKLLAPQSPRMQGVSNACA